MNAHPRSNLIGPEVLIDLAEIAGIDLCNSRSQEPDDIAALAASLASDGQHHPLLVRRHDGGMYFVLAGGRRWRAFQVLAAANGAQALRRIRVRVFNGDDSAAREASLAENVQRQALHPLDEAERFAALVETARFDDVAAHFGVTRRRLREALALAALAPDVKQAWRDGRFGLEHAKAFAVGGDAAEQAALLARPDLGNVSPLEIRRRLTQRAVAASHPSAIFVGAEAYVAAGGTVLEDLFGEAARFADRALLERLENDKLARISAALRAEEGWGFVVAPEDVAPPSWQIELDRLAVEAARVADIDRALNAESTPEAYAALLAERDDLDRLAALRTVPVADRHRYGVAVSVDAEGRLFVERALKARDAIPLAGDRDRDPVRPDAGERGPSSEEGLLPLRREGDAFVVRPGGVAGDDSVAAGAARRETAPTRRSVPVDAPLSAAARRIAETAATRALAAAVAGDAALAQRLALAAFVAAGPHRRPVGVRREQGPWSVRSELARMIGKSAFDVTLRSLRFTSPEERACAFAECVAASIDCRGADPKDNAALIEDAGRYAPGLRDAIADAFDYAAFFREASRATALLAIRQCGGEALEASHAWRADEALRHEAALIARARRWLPDCLTMGESAT